MALFKKLLLVLVTSGLILVTLLFTAPWYLPSILSSLLANQGVVIKNIQIRFPGTNSWIIPRVEMQTDSGVVATAEMVMLHYRLGALLQGRVQALDIKTLQITGTTTTSQSSKQDYQFPSFEQWLQAMPVSRISIDEGTLFENISVDQFDLQIIDRDLNMRGMFLVNGQVIDLRGEVTKINDFNLRIDSQENTLQLNGNFDTDRIVAKGVSQLDIDLLKPWLPASMADFSGRLTGNINLELTNSNALMAMKSTIHIQGELLSPMYFDKLQLDQTVKISGTPKNTTVLLTAGDSVVVNVLHRPLLLDQVTLALTSDLQIDDIFNNFHAAQAATLQLRTDQDFIDLSFQGKQLTVKGKLASITPSVELATDIEIESTNPVRLRISSGATATIENIDKIGVTTLVTSSDSLIATNDDNVSFASPLQLSIKNALGDFIVNVSGTLAPLDLETSARTNELYWQQTAYGPASATLLANGSEQIALNLEATVLATTLVAKSDLNADTKLGNLSAGIANLSQLNQYFSRQCIEIGRGSIEVVGKVDLTDGVNAQGDVTLKNLSFSLQDTPMKNLQFSGKWQYSADGDQGFELAGRLQMPKLGIGIEVTEFNADIRWQGDSISIDKLEGIALGGSLYSENQRWVLGQSHQELLLTLNEIDLQKLVALEDYGGLKVSGKINARLPLVVDSGRVQVVGGKIEAVRPGGEIHLPVDSTNRTGAEKEAFEALQNFHYEVMSGGVSGPIALDPDGILMSQLTIRGMNPDMGRPISLNLTIEQNTYPIFQTLELFNKINRIGQCSPDNVRPIK